VPGLYADSWYNGKEIEKGWLGNIEDYLVGIPRVRLLRIQQGKIISSTIRHFPNVVLIALQKSLTNASYRTPDIILDYDTLRHVVVSVYMS
jgi:hypothetical protein